MTTFGYCKVSTIDQIENNNSLNIQQEQIKTENRARGVESIAYSLIGRGISRGKSIIERPQKKVLRCLESNDEIIALQS